jgi:hypothetical protein
MLLLTLDRSLQSRCKCLSHLQQHLHTEYNPVVSPPKILVDRLGHLSTQMVAARQVLVPNTKTMHQSNFYIYPSFKSLISSWKNKLDKQGTQWIVTFLSPNDDRCFVIECRFCSSISLTNSISNRFVEPHMDLKNEWIKELISDVHRNYTMIKTCFGIWWFTYNFTRGLTNKETLMANDRNGTSSKNAVWKYPKQQETPTIITTFSATYPQQHPSFAYKCLTMYIDWIFKCVF